MTEMTRRHSEPRMASAEDVRFAGNSLEQTLGGLAAVVCDQLPAGLEVAIVVRDRRGVRTWGFPVGSILSVVNRRAANTDHAIDLALDEGAIQRCADLIVAPLDVVGRVIGAAVLTGRSVGLLGADDLALVVTATAAIAVATDNAMAYAEVEARARNLEIAMRSRAVIEQAKGVIIARRGCDAGEAFDILRDLSQRDDVKIATLAGQVVAKAQR